MGTWSIPKTAKEFKKAAQLLKDIKEFEKDCYNVLGDDELFDLLDNAQDRMKFIIAAARAQQEA